jgi:hypothetical protein
LTQYATPDLERAPGRDVHEVDVRLVTGLILLVA